VDFTLPTIKQSIVGGEEVFEENLFIHSIPLILLKNPHFYF